MPSTNRAPRNRTITLNEQECSKYKPRLNHVEKAVQLPEIIDSTINQDLFDILGLLPVNSFDLVFADPPYNLTKSFNGVTFKQTDLDEYENWLESWLPSTTTLQEIPVTFAYVFQFYTYCM